MLMAMLTAHCCSYGPIYRPTRYSFSTAFLATEGFLDTDSLAARMIQARFTGYFRFGCRSFLEFMADPANAAAGSNAPPGSQRSNPDDFDSRFDRNIMLIATILFAESYGIETRGGVYPIDPLQLWRETCEFPNGFRNAVPTSMWQLDPDVYGESDFFGHEIEPLDIAPIRTYGSLAQIQGRAGTHHEDWTQDLPPEENPGDDHALFFKNARDHRDLFSPDAFVRDRLCDPEHVLSVEEAIGNAPHFTTDIRDSSNARLRQSDMRVPAGARGESAFESTRYASRECPEGGDCDLELPFSFRDSSMLTRVYVTSSDDPDVIPGVHRLLDLKAFPDVDCNLLKEQRCGVTRTLVPHGRKKPKCGFFCTLGKAAEGVASTLLVVGTAAMSVHPSPIVSTLGDMGSDVASYLYPMPPPGKSTDVVQCAAARPARRARGSLAPPRADPTPPSAAPPCTASRRPSTGPSAPRTGATRPRRARRSGRSTTRATRSRRTPSWPCSGRWPARGSTCPAGDCARATTSRGRSTGPTTRSTPPRTSTRTRGTSSRRRAT